MVRWEDMGGWRACEQIRRVDRVTPMELIFEKQKPTKKFLNFRTVTTSSIFSHSVKMEWSVLWFNLFLQQNYNSLSFSILGKGYLPGYGNV